MEKYKNTNSILYYKSNTINKKETILKIVVKEIPRYIYIDPFGTRSDENFVDNLVLLNRIGN